MSAIIQVFHKNKGNSMAIGRIFREKMENLSHFDPLYLSCKGLNTLLFMAIVRQ